MFCHFNQINSNRSKKNCTSHGMGRQNGTDLAIRTRWLLCTSMAYIAVWHKMRWIAHIVVVPRERDDAVRVGVVIPQARAESPGVGQNLRHRQRHHCSFLGSVMSSIHYLLIPFENYFIIHYFFSFFISQGVNKGVPCDKICSFSVFLHETVEI